jgi:hypothetical protein
MSGFRPFRPDTRSRRWLTKFEATSCDPRQWQAHAVVWMVNQIGLRAIFPGDLAPGFYFIPPLRGCGGIKKYGPSGIFYKANAAVDGAPNFASRLMSNSRSFAGGICNTAAGTRGSFDRPVRGFLRIVTRIPSWARRDRTHFLRQSVAFAGGRQMGKFKNSADGRASLIPIVRAMRRRHSIVTRSRRWRSSDKGTVTCPRERGRRGSPIC